MPTEQEILDYIGLDVFDDMIDRNLARCKRTAQRFLEGAVGAPLPDDPRLKEVALMVIDHLYSQRGLSQKTEGALHRLFDGMLLQLRLEMRDTNAV